MTVQLTLISGIPPDNILKHNITITKTMGLIRVQGKTAFRIQLELSIQTLGVRYKVCDMHKKYPTQLRQLGDRI